MGDILTVREGGVQGLYSMVLETEPTHDVSAIMGLDTSASAEIKVLPEVVVFSPSN